ncbi:MAG TPA: hypothetical protein VMH22_13850 [bacterium]|nr:hypothetical protein [bacterium]
MKALVVVVAMTASVCLAGYWEFEQVDSGSIGSYVAIDKTSDGTIWLAYITRDSAIRLAHRDSVWEYQDLDTALVRPIFPSNFLRDNLPFSFDVSTDGAIGVVGLGRLAQRRDSVWASERLPMVMYGLSMSYDPAGRPSLTFKDSLGRGCVGLKTGPSWDTNVFYVPQNSTWATITAPAWRRNGNCALIVADWWSMGLQDGYEVSFKRRDSGVWTDFGGTGGLDGEGIGLAALVDSSDSIHTFWSAADNYVADELVCDGVVLDACTSIGAACLDDSGRVQCAWWARDSLLKFVLLGEPTQVVGGADRVVWCDITTDKLAEPVIAFCRSDGSIWVAHGVGIVGLTDEPRESIVRSMARAPSIVRNVLFLPQASDHKLQAAALLDVAGRRVAELHIGANDVSRLAPGVYFVGDEGVGHERAGVRRVVVVR